MEADSGIGEPRAYDMNGFNFNFNCGYVKPLVDIRRSQTSPTQTDANFSSDHGELAGSSSGSCPPMLDLPNSEQNFIGFPCVNGQLLDFQQENTQINAQPGLSLFNNPPLMAPTQLHHLSMENQVGGGISQSILNGSMTHSNFMDQNGNVTCGIIDNSAINSENWPQPLNIETSPLGMQMLGTPHPYLSGQNAEMGLAGGSNEYFENLRNSRQGLNQLTCNPRMDHLLGISSTMGQPISANFGVSRGSQALPHSPSLLESFQQNCGVSDRSYPQRNVGNWTSLNQPIAQCQNSFHNNLLLQCNNQPIAPTSQSFYPYADDQIGDDIANNNMVAIPFEDGRSPWMEWPQQSNWLTLKHAAPSTFQDPSRLQSNQFMANNTFGPQYVASRLPGSSEPNRPHLSDRALALANFYDALSQHGISMHLRPNFGDQRQSSLGPSSGKNIFSIDLHEAFMLEKYQHCRERNLMEIGESSTKRSKIEANTKENGRELFLSTSQESMTSNGKEAISTLNSRSAIKNSVYDPRYESLGLPVDPHLRLFAVR